MAAYSVTTAATRLEFDTQVAAIMYNSCFSIDSNHFINFWLGGATTTDGFAQVFTVDTSTWAVTTAASTKLFDTDVGSYNSCFKVDTNHFINFWGGASEDGFVQTFAVNTTTWAITTSSAQLEFDTAAAAVYNSCTQVDVNHFINFWQGPGADGFVQVFVVDTTTYAVTTAAASLEFDVGNNHDNSCCMVDVNHAINFWGGVSEDGFTQIFTINTTTWVVTTAAASLEYDTRNSSYNSCFKIDDTHVINFWSGITDRVGTAQVFAINTTTWEITTAAATITYNSGVTTYNSCRQLDSNHFINFWFDQDNSDGEVQVFTVNTSTWVISTTAALLAFDTQNAVSNAAFQIDSNHFINFWGGDNNGNGFVQTFAVELASGVKLLPLMGVGT